jgi:hypothetical protein
VQAGEPVEYQRVARCNLVRVASVRLLERIVNHLLLDELNNARANQQALALNELFRRRRSAAVANDHFNLRV